MEKAKYRVLRLSHIHNNLWPEGSEIEYDGEPGSALEPLNDAAIKAKKDAAKKRGEKYDAPEITKKKSDDDGGQGNSDEVESWTSSVKSMKCSLMRNRIITFRPKRSARKSQISVKNWASEPR